MKTEPRSRLTASASFSKASPRATQSGSALEMSAAAGRASEVTVRSPFFSRSRAVAPASIARGSISGISSTS